METQNASYEVRLRAFSEAISQKTMLGFQVADRNDATLIAVLFKPAGKVNHILHFLIAIISCGFWFLVWGYLILTKEKERRMRITVDETGEVQIDRFTV